MHEKEIETLKAERARWDASRAYVVSGFRRDGFYATVKNPVGYDQDVMSWYIPTDDADVELLHKFFEWQQIDEETVWFALARLRDPEYDRTFQKLS